MASGTTGHINRTSSVGPYSSFKETQLIFGGSKRMRVQHLDREAVKPTVHVVGRQVVMRFTVPSVISPPVGGGLPHRWSTLVEIPVNITIL